MDVSLISQIWLGYADFNNKAPDSRLKSLGDKMAQLSDETLSTGLL